MAKTLATNDKIEYPTLGVSDTFKEHSVGGKKILRSSSGKKGKMSDDSDYPNDDNKGDIMIFGQEFASAIMTYDDNNHSTIKSAVAFQMDKKPAFDDLNRGDDNSFSYKKDNAAASIMTNGEVRKLDEIFDCADCGTIDVVQVQLQCFKVADVLFLRIQIQTPLPGAKVATSSVLNSLISLPFSLLLSLLLRLRFHFVSTIHHSQQMVLIAELANGLQRSLQQDVYLIVGQNLDAPQRETLVVLDAKMIQTTSKMANQKGPANGLLCAPSAARTKKMLTLVQQPAIQFVQRSAPTTQTFC
jgi:hypothetical protein